MLPVGGIREAGRRLRDVLIVDRQRRFGPPLIVQAAHLALGNPVRPLLHGVDIGLTCSAIVRYSSPAAAASTFRAGPPAPGAPLPTG